MSSKERRSSERIDVEVYAHYSLPNYPDKGEKATVVNISSGGIGFLANELLKEGEEVHLRLELNQDESATLKTIVVWRSEIGDTKRYNTGVKITELTGEEVEKYLIFYYEQLANRSDKDAG